MNMAGFVIYLIDVCHWKDDAVRYYKQSNGEHIFDKRRFPDMKIHKARACYIYLRESHTYQVDFLEGDTVSGSGASEPQ